jgi:tetratricopeptide (TPR) repeat protein
MMGRTLPVLAIITMFVAATPAGAVRSTQKPESAMIPEPTNLTLERPDAKALLREAKDLWHMKQDYTGALHKFNAAIEADPTDSDVRLQRAHFFEALSVIVVPSDKPKFEARAQLDYEHIAEADPDSLVAGIARDGLTRLAGKALIEPKRVSCPDAAQSAHAHGDALYGARRYEDAAVEYEKATAGCPNDAVYWVDFADAYYVMGNYVRAKELFVKALSVDPWTREAHRFLSDTELQLQNGEEAVHHLVLAVVSDPIYEAGWSALRTYADAMGRKWNRVYGDRRADPGNADGMAWTAYGEAKSSVLVTDPKPASALAIEREAVKSALKAARAVEANTSQKPGAFWSMMARAERAGFLDEAIFIHMLDEASAAEYPAFREKHAERLVAYLETVILP